MGVTRRQIILTGTALGGGLLLGVLGAGVHLQTHNRLKVQRKANRDPTAAHVNLWLRITPENDVLLINPHTDMGQGSATGLLQIVADELDADWSQMQIQQAPVEIAYSNGKVLDGLVRDSSSSTDWANHLFENGFYRIGDLMKMQMTGGSTAVRFTGWQTLRKAAAASRQMMLNAAAERFAVPVETLTTRAGTVVRSDTGELFTYGQLAQQASVMDSPDVVSFRSVTDYRYIGQSIDRVDVPFKVMANADYGIDADVPDLKYAAVVPSGVFGAQVKSIGNVDDVMAMRGVSDVLIVPDGVAVIADNPWRAEKAVKAVSFEREPHANDMLNTKSLLARQRDALSSRCKTAMSVGAPNDIEAQFSVEYQVPYLAHGTLEPMNATVWRQDDKLHVICGVQNPLLAKARVAKEANLDFDDIVFHARQMGGGFGRRVAFSMTDDEPLNWLVQAVRIAIDTNKPVKTTWSRETDIRSDVYRPMVVSQFEGALNDDGIPILWRSKSYGKEMNIKGVAPPYTIANIDVGFAKGKHPVPTGFWRSVEHSQHGFFVESFIDELAEQAGKDPLQYRLDLLGAQSAQARVLRKVAEMSGWRYGVDKQNRAMGVAVVTSFGSTVAQVVEASIASTGIRAHRVWCAVDCGVAINPQSIEAQLQGAINYALSAALYGKCDIENGAVVQSNFHDYPLVDMAHAPRIQVQLLQSDSDIGGVGEIGVPPLAPALSNALSVLDGLRRRELPLSV